MESRSVIHATLEEDGRLLVTFLEHDGYFSVPLAQAALCEKLRAAEAARQEVSFTFDRDLTILSIL